MTQLTAEEIYLVARHAGFSPDQAVTMTAIALAESGGNISAHNSTGEDSRGLWQINLAAHGDRFAGLDAASPLDNAKMAFEVSNRGNDIGRWTVTHADNGARYLQFRDEAERAASAFGETDARGNWDPPANYHSPKVAAGIDPFRPPPTELGDNLTLGRNDAGTGSRGTGMETFLEAALAQEGDAYVFGHETDVGNDNPDTFDCSELVQWAAGRAGVEMPDGSWIQYRELQGRGSALSVEEALRTPGALLFRFSDDPLSGGRPGSAHVAISLGDGTVIEARGTKYGVGVFTAEDRGWTHAGAIPELGSIDSLPRFTEPLPFGQDSDGDSLLDAFESMIGTDPFNADTDLDGFSDATELVQHDTDPLEIGSNFMSRATGLRPIAPAILDVDRIADGMPDRVPPLSTVRTASTGDTVPRPDLVQPHETVEPVDPGPAPGQGGIADAPSVEEVLGDLHLAENQPVATEPDLSIDDTVEHPEDNDPDDQSD